MKLLYFFLFNFSISVATEYVELEEFLNPIITPIKTLNNLPHDIKMLIAEKIYISDIPNLVQTTPAFYRFFKTYFSQEYLDSIEAAKKGALSYAQLSNDLDSPYKVVKLLKLLNRLYKYKYDTSFIEHDKIIIDCSKLRFSPTFLLLGGREELNKFFIYYCHNKKYAPKIYSLLNSIRKDPILLPLIFAILSSIFYYHAIPNIISKYKQSGYLKEKFSYLTGLTSEELPTYYNQDEIDIVNTCKPRWKSCEFVYCTARETNSSCEWGYKLFTQLCKSIPNEIKNSWEDIISNHNFSHPNHDQYFNKFVSLGSNFIKFVYNDNQWYPIGSGKPYSVFAGYYLIKETCLISTGNINFIICLVTIIPGLILIALLIDKIYLAFKKKNQANLNIQNIYRNL